MRVHHHETKGDAQMLSVFSWPGPGSTMRTTLAAVLMMGVFVPLPTIALAQSTQRAESPAASGQGSAVHATRGVVKAIDAKTLVVSRPKGLGDITFDLAPTLHREGTITVGSMVAVRYRDEGQHHVATAISLQRPRE